MLCRQYGKLWGYRNEYSAPFRGNQSSFFGKGKKRSLEVFDANKAKKGEAEHFFFFFFFLELSTSEDKKCSLALSPPPPPFCFDQALYLVLKSVGPHSLREAELGLGLQELRQNPLALLPVPV